MLRALGKTAPSELRDVARTAGLNKVTTFRILGTLVREGFASRPPDTQLYDLGPELTVLAAVLDATLATRIDLRAAARPALATLAARSADAAILSIRTGPDAVCIDRQTGTFPIQSNHLHPGTRRPLGVGAGALAILAALPNAESEAIMTTLADHLAPFPKLSLTLIRAQMQTTRTNGHALVADLIVEGLAGIAAPIRAPDGQPIGAFSILGLTERITSRTHDLATLLHQAIADTERALAKPPNARR